MVDPISLLQTQRLTTNSSDSANRAKKEKTDTPLQSLLANTQNQKIQDIVNFTFNVNGDLDTLKQSVDTVYDQIKQQLEKYYGMTGTEPDESLSQLPENASAQQILDYVSPENTAKRIDTFTTGFFSAYLDNHTDTSKDDNVNNFVSMMNDAIQKGFDQAEGILGSFDKLGEIGENIKKTFELVQKGMEDFRQRNLSEQTAPADNAEEPEEETTTTTETTTSGINLIG